MSQIVAVAPALPGHRYSQQQITDAFAEVVLPPGTDRGVLDRLHRATGVTYRHLALPLDAYAGLADFGAANDAFIEVGTRLGAQAVGDALAAAGLAAEDVDIIVTTSVTGIAAPSLDARLVPLLGLRPDVRRIPVFGLGCVAGAAGVARVDDLLRGDPDAVAVLLSVELCSLTVQRDDSSMANLVGSGLFGDGAAAVVMVGDRRAAAAGAARSARGRLAQPALPGHRAGDGLGRRRQRLPDRAVCRRTGARRGAPRPRHVGLPRRPRAQDRRHRHLGGAPGRAQGAGGDGAHPRPRRRTPCGAPGRRCPGWATCRRPRCCTCSPTPSPTSRRRPARRGCCWRWARASAPSWCCCCGEQRRAVRRAGARGRRRAGRRAGRQRAQPPLVAGPRRHRVGRRALPGDGGAAHRPAGGRGGRGAAAGPAVPAVAGLADAGAACVAAQAAAVVVHHDAGPAVVHPHRRRAGQPARSPPGRTAG